MLMVVQKQMIIAAMKMLQWTVQMAFWASLCLMMANITGIPASYAQLRTKPRPLTSYAVDQIGNIASNPQTYNLRLVRFKGLVSAIRATSRGVGIPVVTNIFTLTDDTGAIDIFYAGNIGILGPLKTDLLVEGKMIDVLVTISYVSVPGSQDSNLAANLRWVESQ